jgi:RNA-directed DNA polymerase
MQMTGNTGAVPDDQIDWDAIDWDQVEKEVKRLQARIVKAELEGRHNKVKVLQGLLTRSRSGKLLAIKRVTENDGSKTPGVDKVTWEHPRSKERAVTLLQPRGYKPQPLRRILIPKSNGKMRPLGIPTMLDRAMQALYLLGLDPVAESLADPNSYGFRIGRSCADAIQQCFSLICGGKDRWILEADIKGCFDHISHNWLLEHVPMERPILRKWLKCGYMDRHAFYPTEEGTPQGGIISPVLANLTLDGLEKLLETQFPKRGKGSLRNRLVGVNLVRYADDFVITATNKEVLETRVRPLVEQFLQERGLELSSEKTKITHSSEGFDFLGQNARAYRDKTIIQPSKKNEATFLKKIRTLIKANAQMPAAGLIKLLNPIIRGWANYHRHVCSKATFTYVDHQIFHCLMSWARRRHTRDRKNKHWVSDKYFGTCGNQNWRFFGDHTGKNSQSVRYWLAQAAHTPIVRHTKVIGAANPYSPEWQEYFAQRRNKRKGKEHEPDSDIYDKQVAFTFGLRPLRPEWGV